MASRHWGPLNAGPPFFPPCSMYRGSAERASRPAADWDAKTKKNKKGIRKEKKNPWLRHLINFKANDKILSATFSEISPDKCINFLIAEANITTFMCNHFVISSVKSNPSKLVFTPHIESHCHQGLNLYSIRS